MSLEVVERSPRSEAHATPLLFIHGMWHGAWCWEETFLPFFAEHGYRSAALSLRGHGNSEGRIRGSTIADYVNDVEEAVRRLGTQPVLIGHSMGGFVTQKYLEKHPAPAGVLLAAIPPSGIWHPTWAVFKHDPLILMKVIAQLRLYPAVETLGKARWALFSEDFPEDQLEKFHAKMCDESFRAYIDLLGLNIVNPKRVRTPLLVLGAEKDTVILPGDVHQTARAYGVKAELFPDMAHDMMLEKGWRTVAERILIWLKEKGL